MRIGSVLENHDITYKFRFVPHGGHMVKILNFVKFYKKYKIKKNNKTIKNITLDFFNSELSSSKIIITKSPNLFYLNYLDQIWELMKS